MTVPTKPYCSTAQVGLLVPNLLGDKTDFDTDTNPKVSAVEQYISWIGTQIELQFQMAGYVLPFQVMSGETWPQHQTEYLQLTNALGAAAMSGGHVHVPAPAISPGRGQNTGNLYQDLYNKELVKIYNSARGLIGEKESSQLRFRAAFYAGTPAERAVTEPSGPNLDYMAGKMNPEDFFSFENYTVLRHNIENYIFSNYHYQIDWTEFYDLFGTKLTKYTY
jgi:hypothetical protein